MQREIEPATEETNFYIRSGEGNTFYVKSLEDGLKHLTSDDGYRLTISEGDNAIVVRKYEEITEEADTLLNQRTFTAEITVRIRSKE